MSSYKLNSLDGVEKSQNMSCVDFCSFVSSHIRRTLRTQALTLLSGSSSSPLSMSLWSRPIFLPSEVILSMLSCHGSTRLFLTSSARSASFSIIFNCSSVGGTATFSKCASGTGRFRTSAVFISATSRNMAINSGRLKNLEKRVRAR